MQPIPLVEIAKDHSSDYLAIIGIALILLGTVLMVTLSIRLKRNRGTVPETLLGFSGAISLLLGLAVIVVGAVSSPNYGQLFEDQLRDQTASAQAEIEDTYGLKLTESEVQELAYPYGVPESDFKVYGSILQREQIEGAQFIERTIYLVWADGELQLSESEDGKSFDELEPTK